MRYRLQQLGLVDRAARCAHGAKPLPKLPGYFRRLGRAGCRGLEEHVT